MADAKAKTKTRTEFHEFCMSRGVSSSVDDPFWKDFPYTNINLSITITKNPFFLRFPEEASANLSGPRTLDSPEVTYVS